MKQRGRKSAAARATKGLAVIDGGRGSRPSPPADLDDYEAAKWAEVVGAMPADWFSPEMTDLLREYCKTSKILHKINSLIDTLDGDLVTEVSPEALPTLLKLTRSRDVQVRQHCMLATKLRLTPQARQEPKTLGRAKAKHSATPAQPWEG